ncbi:FtsW/RodA/SpoVE family cell cycle protein [Nocardioides sp. Kera G14]|uniref:FtsW/RodA/SpoVE family cell cycle protein n=1 Tax=Nocardioides sp. Kera G14 TaxID=2884264 RepID=UPI001D0F8A24|nr:FtsW/RodA/SpoVE family cell cycle protein [Nocardioides sp. Kera G14]UDY23631.1 FtsW/RodA/SpoVE family cell cycle protein [Nocardioides sp. Kera G14]
MVSLAVPPVAPGFVHRSRRNAELVLVVLALVVGIGAYAAVGLGVDHRVPADIYRYGGWLVALILAAHVAIRMVAPYADPVLLPIVAALNGLGLAVIHRIDLAHVEAGTHTDFAAKQLFWMTLGVALFVATLFFLTDHRNLQRFTYTSGLAAVVLLLLPMAPGIGRNVNGARIWIHLGSLSFQPGEVAKVLLVISFAGYLVLHRDALALAGRRVAGIDLPRGRDLGPILGMWLVSLVVLMAQRDLGSGLLFFGLFIVMLYIATERSGWLAVGGALFVVGVGAIWLFSGSIGFLAHVRNRFDIWLHPMEYYDRSPGSFQLVEGLFGQSWGGLIGRGFGEGRPTRVPYAESDFIIASIGEELGLAAVMAVIVLYALIVERGLRTALISRDNVGKLIAAGLAVSVGLQVFTVIGGVTRLIPLTGLTTPFLSYGGSSLVANWVIVALLLRISDHARRPLPDLKVVQDDTATQVIRGVQG